MVDFDGIAYRLSTPDPNNRDVVRLSMSMKCYSRDLVKYGAKEVLQREYGSMLKATPEQGYDVTLEFDLRKMVQRENKGITESLECCFVVMTLF